jgi:RNA polymerase sigma factor (sigma-70 family)
LVTLVEQAQAGSSAAAELLYKRYREPLLAVIRSVLSQPLRRLYDSDSFLNEAFAEIFSRHFSDEVLRSPDTLWPYLKKIAQNKVLDAKRKYLWTAGRCLARDVPLEDLAEEEWPESKELSPEETVILKELIEDRLLNLIGQLPDLLQTIIHLVLAGECVTVIANRLGVEQKRVYRAIEWLKRKICES